MPHDTADQYVVLLECNDTMFHVSIEYFFWFGAFVRIECTITI